MFVLNQCFSLSVTCHDLELRWGVVFMEVVSGNEEFRENAALQYWFGSLGRSMLTMFECVLSGVSWDVVVRPLITHFSPAMGALPLVNALKASYLTHIPN
eukprot:821285-Amphidinium_carterae.1